MCQPPVFCSTFYYIFYQSFLFSCLPLSNTHTYTTSHTLTLSFPLTISKAFSKSTIITNKRHRMSEEELKLHYSLMKTMWLLLKCLLPVHILSTSLYLSFHCYIASSVWTLSSVFTSRPFCFCYCILFVSCKSLRLSFEPCHISCFLFTISTLTSPSFSRQLLSTLALMYVWYRWEDNTWHIMTNLANSRNNVHFARLQEATTEFVLNRTPVCFLLTSKFFLFPLTSWIIFEVVNILVALYLERSPDP